MTPVQYGAVYQDIFLASLSPTKPLAAKYIRSHLN